MTEKFGMRCAYGAFGIVVTAIFVVALAPPTQSQAQRRPTPSAPTQQADVCDAGMTQQRCVPQVIRMRLGTVSTEYTLDRSFKTIQIGNPNFVDVQVITDRSFNLHALAIGRTNIVLFGEMGGAVKNLDVIVEDDFQDPNLHTVEIHNLSQLSGSSSFLCSATRCQYLKATELLRPTEVIQYRGLGGPGGPSPPPR
jgi:hypothetical protein